MKNRCRRTGIGQQIYALVLIALSVFLVSASFAQDNITFEYTPANGEFGCDESLTVDMMIDATVVDLQGFTFDLTFDPEIVTPTSVTAGGLMTGQNFIDWDIEGNTLIVDIGTLGYTVDGPGHILRIVFEDGGKRGSSALTAVAGIMRNSANMDIPFSVAPGTLVNICNHDPIAVDDGPYPATEGQTLNVAAVNGVLANDSDPDDDPLTATTTPISGPDHGTLTLNTDGSFAYTHDGSENFTDAFVYEVTDGQGGAAQATAEISVTAVNDPPVANDNDYGVAEGGTLTVLAPGVLENDTDAENDPLTAHLDTGPAYAASFQLNEDGAFTYEHDDSEIEEDTFTYHANDGQDDSNIATVTITITSENDQPVVDQPDDQADVEQDSPTLQITATDPDPGDEENFVFDASNLPAGLSIAADTGLISGTIECGAAAGSPYTVTVTVDDQSGAPNSTGSAQFTWTVGALPAPAAIADLDANQQTSGNDSDGTTNILLGWTDAGFSIAAYRIGFGGYPLFDDGGGAAPGNAPATPQDAVDEGWTHATAVTIPDDADEPADRDFWYYVAFATNACGTVSPVSNMTTGTLNYHLGDVRHAIDPAAIGDNLVTIADVSLLGAVYDLIDTDPAWVDSVDVGPTTDLSVDTMPTTDGVIDFEDMILFCINFSHVSKLGPPPAKMVRNLLSAYIPDDRSSETFSVSLWMEANGSIQGMSIPLTWNAKVVEPVGFTPGELLQRQGGLVPVFSPQPGMIDIGLFGRREVALSGEGEIATIEFRTIGRGEPDIGFATLKVRNSDNQPMDLETTVEFGDPEAGTVPSISAMGPNYPNPFNPITTLQYGVARTGRVSVRVYDLAGRLVRTLVDENKPAGNFSVQWRGDDDRGRSVAAGAYIARFVAPDRSESQRMLLLK